MDARTEEAKHYHKHYKNLISSTLYEVDQDDNPTIVQKYMLAMSDVRELEELLNELHHLKGNNVVYNCTFVHVNI